MTDVVIPDKKKFKRVFILGAGSNQCYDFPTGEGLRNLIIGDDIQDLTKYVYVPYAEFKNFFRESGMQSVDRFIEQNQKFEEIGKKIIAWYISRKENPSALNIGEKHWYFYIFNRLLQEIKTLTEGEISFITFNYDRSLEHFLYQSLFHTFLSKSQEELTEYKNLFSIYHVYGQVGSIISTSEIPARSYSPPSRFSDVDSFYKGIHLVTTRDEDLKRFDLLKKTVKGADVIYCIGFGFDALNMERIGLTQNDLACKAIFSTSVNVGLAERLSIINKITETKRQFFRWYSPQKEIIEFLRDLYVNEDDLINMLLDRSLHPEEASHELITWMKRSATRPVKVY